MPLPLASRLEKKFKITSEHSTCPNYSDSENFDSDCQITGTTSSSDIFHSNKLRYFTSDSSLKDSSPLINECVSSQVRFRLGVLGNRIGTLSELANAASEMCDSDSSSNRYVLPYQSNKKTQPLLNCHGTMEIAAPSSNYLSPLSNQISDIDFYFQKLRNIIPTVSLSDLRHERIAADFLASAMDILSSITPESLAAVTDTARLENHSIDSDASIILKRCDEPYDKWRPLLIVPDGNCAFNSCAVYLKGYHSEQLSKLIRLYSALELISHAKDYIRHLRQVCMSNDDRIVLAEVWEEVRHVCKLGDWVGIPTFMAL